jgi:hypothetical protein
MTIRLTWIWNVSLAALLSLTGCTFTDDLSGQIDRTSESIHTATMKALLLNIVRSSHGEPVSFTQATNVTSTGSISGNLGLPFVLFGSGPTSPQLSRNGFGIFGNNAASVQNGNNINLAVLDNREFWMGMLTPLSFDTVNFFISQGVPRDVVFRLYIQQEVKESPQGSVIYTNDTSDTRYGEFLELMRRNLELGMTAVALPRSQSIGPPMSASEVTNLRHLVELAQAGFQLTPVSSKEGVAYQLMRRRPVSTLCFDQKLASADVVGRIEPQSTCSAMAADAAPHPPEPPGPQAAFSFQANKSEAEPEAPSSTYTLYPRSTYGVIRYLGQIMRAGLDNPAYNTLVDGIARDMGLDPIKERLFLVRKNAPITEKSFVSVEYRGDTYSIPVTATTTIEVVGLLRQMIALSLSVNALPAGAATTVIAQ